MLLLIDIGNSRIKWGTFEGEQLEPSQAMTHSEWSIESCSNAFASVGRPQRILVSNVGGERAGEVVTRVAQDRWQLAPQFIQSTTAAAGITNAYPQPANLGVDRWLAMIAAYASYRQAVCVVSVGTAATIDGVAADGQHLGGLIIPGPDLMVDSLLKNTSDIAQRAKQGTVGAGLFADNTLGAIRQGSAHAVAALVERAFVAMRERLQMTPRLVLTGGAAASVGALIQLDHTTLNDAVLRGLTVIARESGP